MVQTEARFSDFVHEENVLCRFQARTRDDALSELTHLLSRNAGGFDPKPAVAGIIEREGLAPTLIAPGLALPHARLAGLKEPLVAVGLSGEGIEFDPAEPLARILILVLTPKSDPSAYLRLVSAISKSLGAAQNRQRLLACGSPAEVCAVLAEGLDQLPAYLCARNVMNPSPVVVRESDDLATAIHALSARRVFDVPVVDDEGDVKGVFSQEDILRLSLPEHLLWMEDLTSILNFQPFSELLRKDEETRVADFMREDYTSIHPDVPAIQLAKIFLQENVRQVLVVEDRRLLGTVGLCGFIAQLFWA